MKKMLLLVGMAGMAFQVNAQSLEDGVKDIYYERYSSAENIFHGVLQQDPANAAAWFWLTKSYLLQHDSTAAADSFAKAPAAIMEEPYGQIAKGALLLNNNHQQEAAVHFQNAMEATKNKDAGLIAAIAGIHIDARSGDAGYANELLELAKKRDKKNATLWISQGRAQRKLHDGTAAFQAFKEAIEKDKHAARAYYELGRIFLTQKGSELPVEYFQQAVEADPRYAPAYRALYDYYLYRDPVKAKQYFQYYAANTESNLQLAYSYTDLLYLNNNFDSSILMASSIVRQEGSRVQPRLYKLLAYSYGGKTDTATSLKYMQEYFRNEEDSNFVIKDFETMARLYAAAGGMVDSAMHYYERAAALAMDSAQRNGYYRQLVGLSKAGNDYAAEAKWQGRNYNSAPGASNVTLFNWGIAAYKAKDYDQADTVFGLYTQKYPEQGFGYYWRARCNAARDSALELGLAIDHYQKLIDVIHTDSIDATQKKWLAEAYGYLATYATNTKKDYEGAIGYFQKLLELDPANEQAKKYISILEKNIEIKEKNTTEVN